MRKFLLVIFIITFFAVPALAVEYVPGDVLVVLKPDTSQKITAFGLRSAGREAFYAASFASSSGAWIKNTYGALSEAGNNIHALIHSDTKTPEELCAELLKNPNVLAASPNYMFKAAIIPDDTFYSSCWGMEYINAPDAWEFSTGSSDVYVAVIDSGIDYDNIDLIDNIDTELGKNFVSTTTAPIDDYGHGTHVAGTIGAVGNNNLGVAGVSWNVKLISLKVLDSGGNATYADVVSALDYTAELIESGVNIRAINMSMEAYIRMEPTHDNLVQFPLWRAFKAIDDLNYAIIAVAAGNHSVAIGSPTTTTTSSYNKGSYVYPASFIGLNNMISVGAMAQNGSLASFSNTGAEIIAPGVDILSTWFQSSRSYLQSDGSSLRSSNGTSMAVPHVVGAAVLLASINPNLTAYQIKQTIINSANEGRLDLMAAINYLDANTDNIPDDGTAGENYDDYTKYEEVDPTIYEEITGNNEASKSSGGGQCNGEMINIFAVFLALPLVKKLMS